ncbi:hypothetical protein pb186bvf_019599 [Paramecium bursaria]
MGICSAKSSAIDKDRHKNDYAQKQILSNMFVSQSQNKLLKLSIIEGHTEIAYKVLMEKVSIKQNGFVSYKEGQIQQILSLLSKIVDLFTQNYLNQQNSAHSSLFTILVNKLLLETYDVVTGYRKNQVFEVWAKSYKYGTKQLRRRLRLEDDSIKGVYQFDIKSPLGPLLNYMNLILFAMMNQISDLGTGAEKCISISSNSDLEGQNSIYKQIRMEFQ